MKNIKSKLKLQSFKQHKQIFCQKRYLTLFLSKINQTKSSGCDQSLPLQAEMLTSTEAGTLVIYRVKRNNIPS